ncbi:SRPBCC family protein [Kaistia sp. MMO-174]|uniref:SRPBCC family protein n=1 Tax=Kaistia sp. MMO-174 TaxID=3081256 RepID=UPI00301AA802
MLRFLLVAAIVLVAAIGVVLAYAATRPDHFRVERQARIQAPADRIFPLIADFHSWATWSPYEKLDPAMHRSYSGPQSGKGAVYEWSSDGKAGTGRMEIADASPPSRVEIDLAFTRPFQARNVAAFTLEPDGDATRVSWSMDGTTPFLAKVIGLFVDMDKMVGRDFETGLANLKAATETR